MSYYRNRVLNFNFCENKIVHKINNCKETTGFKNRTFLKTTINRPTETLVKLNN